MHIYFKNNPEKFHLDLIWYDGIFGFFEQQCCNKKNKKENKIISDTD